MSENDFHIAVDSPNIMVPSGQIVIFTPRYNKNHLWVAELVQRNGEWVHRDWIRRGDWDGGENDHTDPPDPDADHRHVMSRRNPGDATYFQNSGRAFCRFHGYDPDESAHIIDNGAPDIHNEGDHREQNPMMDDVLDIMDSLPSSPPIRVFAFICHGFNHGVQFGFSKRPNRTQKTNRLMDLIAEKSAHDLIMPIYGCSTAEGPNGGEGNFADYLRDNLINRGITHIQIDGHTIAGRAIECPYVRRFTGQGNAGQGGEWIIEPQGQNVPADDRALWLKWKELLLERHYNLKYRFPFMSSDAIRAEVRSHLD